MSPDNSQPSHNLPLVGSYGLATTAWWGSGCLRWQPPSHEVCASIRQPPQRAASDQLAIDCDCHWKDTPMLVTQSSTSQVPPMHPAAARWWVGTFSVPKIPLTTLYVPRQVRPQRDGGSGHFLHDMTLYCVEYCKICRFCSDHFRPCNFSRAACAARKRECSYTAKAIIRRQASQWPTIPAFSPPV